MCLKCSHAFNLLDARGAISVTERVKMIAQIRALVNEIARIFTGGEGRRLMEFLLEILTEELPASHVRSAAGPARRRLPQGARPTPGSSPFPRRGPGARRAAWSSPADLAGGQEDREEVVTGPPLADRLAPDGSLTPAGMGFARSQGVDESLLEVVRTPKGEYVGFKRKSQGTPTSEVLAAAVPRILGSLSFPKMMRWAEGPFRFSRPIHGLLCVFDGRVVPTAFEGFRATDTTVGHRIAAPGPVKAVDLASYRAALEKAPSSSIPRSARR